MFEFESSSSSVRVRVFEFECSCLSVMFDYLNDESLITRENWNQSIIVFHSIKTKKELDTTAAVISYELTKLARPIKKTNI